MSTKTSSCLVTTWQLSSYQCFLYRWISHRKILHGKILYGMAHAQVCLQTVRNISSSNLCAGARYVIFVFFDVFCKTMSWNLKICGSVCKVNIWIEYFMKWIFIHMWHFQIPPKNTLFSRILVCRRVSWANKWASRFPSSTVSLQSRFNSSLEQSGKCCPYSTKSVGNLPDKPPFFILQILRARRN